MNWKLIILGLITLQTVYQLILHAVQYRSANNPTPANVADVYDAETYAKWKQYSAEKGRLAFLRTGLGWALTVLLLAFNAHAAVAGLFPQQVVVQFLAVLVFQSLVDAAAFVGLNWYDTMVIEEKYGFNRTKTKTFVMDQLRSLLIEILLGFILTGALAGLHIALGDWVLVLFTAVVFIITLAIAFLYPIFSRLGNKFVPLEEGELREKLMALLTKHGYRVKAIEVMDASRRTTKMNAYFTGFGKMKTIVLYDNLVSGMSTDEICAVFAHELGHGLHRDVLKQQCMNLISLQIMAVMVWLPLKFPAMHTAFGFAAVNYGFSFAVLTGAFLGLVQPLTGMAMNAYSRFAEFRADRQAIEEGYGEALVTGLKKLAKENFSHLAPSPVLVVLEYSHPPLSERIAAIAGKDR